MAAQAQDESNPKWGIDMTESGSKYFHPQPIDFALLDMMPSKGMIGGIHWKGRRVTDMRQQLLDDGVPAELIKATFIAGRVRSMHVEGLVESFGGANSGLIWARTQKGTDFLATRDQVLGEVEDSNHDGGESDGS
jgi:hypothetical protein